MEVETLTSELDNPLTAVGGLFILSLRRTAACSVFLNPTNAVVGSFILSLRRTEAALRFSKSHQRTNYAKFLNPTNAVGGSAYKNGTQLLSEIPPTQLVDGSYLAYKSG